MKELVSVVMSTYNENDRWLKQSIESILNQTYKNIEFLIVIDNPDNKLLIDLVNYYQKNDSRIKIIKNEKNLGLVNSLNKALKKAKGNYIARMDADDIAFENRIEIQLDFMKKNKEVDLIGAGIEYIDEEDQVQYRANIYGKSIKCAKKSLSYSNIIPHPTWFFKRNILEKMKGYKNIKYVEDYEFLIRLLDNGFNVMNINLTLLQYRLRKNSISRTNQYIQFQAWKNIRKKNYKKEIEINKRKEKKYYESNDMIKKIVRMYKEKKYFRCSYQMILILFKSFDRVEQLKSLLILKIIN